MSRNRRHIHYRVSEGMLTAAATIGRSAQRTSVSAEDATKPNEACSLSLCIGLNSQPFGQLEVSRWRC